MESMGGAGAKVIKPMKVRVCKRESVAAALPMQDHWLPLSNLDLLMPSVDVSVFFCYTRTQADGHDNNVIVRSETPEPTFGSMLGALKVSLAQVLVSYYAFAGKVVANSSGEPELLCNNSGVDFIEAAADLHLEQLDLYNPDESIEGKLVSSKKRGVLAVQATEFKCGGVVVGCTFDHQIADAYSVNMFLASWAEICRSSSDSIVPCFRRSLLYPRQSSRHLDLTLIDGMYVCLSELPPAPPPPPESPLPNEPKDRPVSRFYYIPADEIRKLQQVASSGHCKPSKLESFSSFLWMMVAKSASSSCSSATDPVNGSNAKTTPTSRMGIVVDGRSRLPWDMSTYFGNVLSIPFGEKAVPDLTEKPLSWIASGVHKFLRAAATEDHFLGLIDWVEAHRPEPALARTLYMGTQDGPPAFVVSSGLRFTVANVDFGWGQPAFGSYHFPRAGDTGYVMPMPSPHSNGDWIIYTHLLESKLSFIESEAANVFRPLTFNYLRYNDI